MTAAGKYVVFLLLLWPAALRAQKEAYIWYFGNGAGISFHTTPPTALTDSKMSTTEGCTSIADSTGNLLFYTDPQALIFTASPIFTGNWACGKLKIKRGLFIWSDDFENCRKSVKVISLL